MSGDMKVYYSTDHDGLWVGVASVVVAPDEQTARRLLSHELSSRGLNGNKPFSLVELDTSEPKAIVLQNGDY